MPSRSCLAWCIAVQCILRSLEYLRQCCVMMSHQSSDELGWMDWTASCFHFDKVISVTCDTDNCWFLNVFMNAGINPWYWCCMMNLFPRYDAEPSVFQEAEEIERTFDSVIFGCPVQARLEWRIGDVFSWKAWLYCEGVAVIGVQREWHTRQPTSWYQSRSPICANEKPWVKAWKFLRSSAQSAASVQSHCRFAGCEVDLAEGVQEGFQKHDQPTSDPPSGHLNWVVSFRELERDHLFEGYLSTESWWINCKQPGNIEELKRNHTTDVCYLWWMYTSAWA